MRRAYYFSDTGFTQQSLRSLGITILQESGVSVSLIDLGGLLYQLPTSSQHLDKNVYIEVKSLSQLSLLLQEITSNDVMFLQMPTNIRFFLKNQNMFLLLFNAKGFKSMIHEYDVLATVLSARNKTRISRILQIDYKRIFFNLSNYLYSAITSSNLFTRIIKYLYKEVRLNLIISDSPNFAGALLFIDRNTEIIKIKSLQLKKYSSKVFVEFFLDKKIVLIDGCGPLHEDFLILGIESEYTSLKKANFYKQDVEFALKIVEGIFNLETIICVHPKCTSPLLKDLYESSRKILTKQTYQQIERNDIVMFVGPSTLIEFAAKLNKQIILYAPHQAPKMHIYALNLIGQKLKIKVYNRLNISTLDFYYNDLKIFEFAQNKQTSENQNIDFDIFLKKLFLLNNN